MEIFRHSGVRFLAPVLFFALGGGAARAADLAFEHGTAVVVLRSPKAIYAAVDSKETTSQYRDGVLTAGERLMCKMARVGPYYSIVSGMVRGTNGFDALKEVSRAYSPGDNLEKLASAARESVPRTLEPLLKALREVDPAAFAKAYTGQAAFQVALIGTEQNSPKVVVVEFRAVETAPGVIALTTKTMSCPGDSPTPTTVYLLGAHEAMDEPLRAHAAAIARGGQDGIEKLIGLEYDSRPDLVGGPVSTLKVGPSGSTLLRNGVCLPNGLPSGLPNGLPNGLPSASVGGEQPE